MSRHSAGGNPYVPRPIQLARPKTNVTISTITVCGAISGTTGLQDVMKTEDIPSTEFPYETTSLGPNSVFRLTDKSPQRFKLAGENANAVEEAHKQFLEYVLLAGGDAQKTAKLTSVQEVSGMRQVDNQQYQELNRLAKKGIDESNGVFETLTSASTSGSRVEGVIQAGSPTPNSEVCFATYSDGTQLFTGAKSIHALDLAVQRFDYWLVDN